MKIIPVIDILNKKVVHAKGGRRTDYQFLKSPLFNSSNPIDVVVALEKLGFKEIYLADLDSIDKNQTNFEILEKIRDNSRIELLVDAGVKNKELATCLFNRNVKKVIVGTETLTSINFLKEAVKLFGENRIIVSLDLKGNKILNNFNLKEIHNPFIFLKTIESFGVSQIIVLDLMRVGSENGVDIQLIDKIMKKFKFDVFVGGGIRGMPDLFELKNLGVSGVLLGTALYANKINFTELRQKNLMTI